MKKLLLFLICLFIAKLSFCQNRAIGIDFTTSDKQKYFAIGAVSSAVSYTICNDYFRSIEPKSARRKALFASALTTLTLGILKESIDLTQTEFNWNADDYGKDLFTAMLGGCTVSVTISLF
jgi:hypothetical protein